MRKKIGLYISHFDPIHKGHIDFANEALRALKLDILYLLVDPLPRYKQGVKDLSHRINMTMLDVSKYPKLGTLVLPNKTNIYDQIRLIQRRFIDSNLYLVIPEDSLKDFFNLNNLLDFNFNNLEIIVGLNLQSPEEVNLKISLLEEISGVSLKHSWFRVTTMPRQHSDIGKQLKQGVRPAEVSSVVFDYIVKEKLYAPESKA